MELSTKETLICENEGGADAFFTYALPDEYAAGDYRVEVDVCGHAIADCEGLLIGAARRDGSAAVGFCGYTCTLYRDMTTIAYFDGEGKPNAFTTGMGTLTDGENYHLSATLRYGVLFFAVTSCRDGRLIQTYTFEPGKTDKDPYDRFVPTVGLRKDENGARFQNFKVTAIHDVLPEPLSDTVCTGGFTLSLQLTVEKDTAFYFGMADNQNGYAVRALPGENRLTLYRVENGRFSRLANRALPLQSGRHSLSVTSQSGVLAVRCDEYPFPVFELPIEKVCGAYAVVGGEISDAVCAPAVPVELGETYVNPINDNGADPDVVLYEGVYYLYVYANNGEDLFMVYTSTDLVHFLRRGYVFHWDDAYVNVEKDSPWSPNVFYNASEKLFYLTFAAIPAGKKHQNRSIFYATSKSPLGPFTSDGPLGCVHEGVREIDGHLYAPGDGKTYISLSRYDCKGNICLEEVELKDGRILAKPETCTRVIIPDAPYDNDGINSLCEGGALYMHGGYYYLLYAGPYFSRHYSESYAVSAHPFGPYVRAKNNPLLQYNAFLDGPGDALLIPSPDGGETFIVYHRHGKIGQCDPRNTCVDRVAFVKDPEGGPDLLVVDGPSTTPKKLPGADKK
ncbi:MAG: family 43 glycosylhydrolase [Clostridia bacterium]|nr:family 43 glycosylhydrolase [Clostridia bacterium]